jgi:type IV pilus assembly protein PilO
VAALDVGGGALNITSLMEKITSLSNRQKYIALGSFAVILIGGWIWLIYLPKSDEIKALNGQIANLNNQIGINRTRVVRLAELKQENQLLETQLAELKEQLPPEAEVEVLLKQVSDLGIGTGLDIKLWKPAERKQNPEGLYTEIPVNVEVTGGYHALGAFFDKISKLPRIINVSGIRMANPKVERDKLAIQTSFVATAFAASAAAPAKPAPTKPKKGSK